MNKGRIAAAVATSCAQHTLKDRRSIQGNIEAAHVTPTTGTSWSF